MAELSSIFGSNSVLIPYFTYSDPNREVFESLVVSAFEAGADAIEIGLPYSDPVADGPTIQASHHRVLQEWQDVSIDDVFDSIKRLKSQVDKPLLIMGAVNLIMQYGVEAFFEHGAAAGLDGVIIPDLPYESSSAYLKASREHGVPLIYLISPLCSSDRIERITQDAEGFIYLISSKGTTGVRESLSDTLEPLVSAIKAVKTVPVVVGFGIRTSEQLSYVNAIADGGIVGSFLVDLVGQDYEDSDALISAVCGAIKGLKAV